MTETSNARAGALPALPLAAAALICVVLGCSDRTIFGSDAFNTDPPRPGPLNGYVVVTNNGDDTLSAVDPGTRRVRWRIPVGFIPVELEGPHHIVADPSGNFVYFNLSEAVVGSGSGPHGSHGGGTIPGFVVKLSARDGSQVAFAQVDQNPGDLTISADGRTLYVTHYDLIKLGEAARTGNMRLADTRLAIINAETMTVRNMVTLCPVAHGGQLSVDGLRLYSTCGTDEIAIVRLDDPSMPVQRVLLPGAVERVSCDQCPYALSIAPDQTVWVSNLGRNGGIAGGGTVQVYDPRLEGFDSTRTISFNGRPLFAAFGPSPLGPFAYRAYIPEQGSGDSVRAYEVNGSQPANPVGQIAFSLSDCFNAHMVSVRANGDGHLVCEGNHTGPGSFVFLDLQNMRMISSEPLGVFADGMALVPAARP